MIVYFSGVSGQTKDFVDRLGLASARIPLKPADAASFTVAHPYILVTPSYAGGNQSFGVPRQVVKFLARKENRDNLLGVIGGGNRNFGEKFCIAADQISEKCGVPVLTRFEITGTNEEAADIKHKIEENWSQLVALRDARVNP